MPSPSLRRKTVPLLLAVLFAFPWAASAAPAFPDLLARAWNVLTAAWNKEGCYIDPNGRCAASRTDEGCNIDPDGRCGQPRAASQADTGCYIDPNGRCRP